MSPLAHRVSQLLHPDGRSLRIHLRRDEDDPDAPDDRYEATRFSPSELPPFVDLREHLTPVEDQGEVGSCTANALAGAYEYLEKRTTGRQARVSRLFIYFNERAIEGTVAEDRGASLRIGIRSLRQHGACAEDTWPYDERYVYTQPAAAAYQEASAHTIDEARRVDVALHDLRHCLAEGYPFVFGLQIFKSFERDGHHGAIAMPDPASDEHLGGHAMLCVGYSDLDRVFLVRNSWGPGWGDAGYCYIPYDYLTHPDYAHDVWTLRRAHNLDFTERGAERRSFGSSRTGRSLLDALSSLFGRGDRLPAVGTSGAMGGGAYGAAGWGGGYTASHPAAASVAEAQAAPVEEMAPAEYAEPAEAELEPYAAEGEAAEEAEAAVEAAAEGEASEAGESTESAEAAESAEGAESAAEQESAESAESSESAETAEVAESAEVTEVAESGESAEPEATASEPSVDGT